jgi:hypothetical protein
MPAAAGRAVELRGAIEHTGLETSGHCGRSVEFQRRLAVSRELAAGEATTRPASCRRHAIPAKKAVEPITTAGVFPRAHAGGCVANSAFVT